MIANIDKTQKYDLNMIPLDRGIDAKKVEKFLMHESIYGRHYAQKIINNTRYVSFNEFKNKLYELIKMLPKKFNLHFDITNYKIGSEHWIICLLWHTIKNNVVNIIVEYCDINQNYPLVIIDDCIYTGIHMKMIVDDLTHEKPILTCKIFTCAPFASVLGKHRINKTKSNGNTMTVINVETVHHINFNDNHMGPVHGPIGLETGCVIPLYFDHKIANMFGSFPQVYNHIIKSPPSREKIKLVERILTRDANHISFDWRNLN